MFQVSQQYFDNIQEYRHSQGIGRNDGYHSQSHGRNHTPREAIFPPPAPPRTSHPTPKAKLTSVAYISLRVIYLLSRSFNEAVDQAHCSITVQTSRSYRVGGPQLAPICSADWRKLSENKTIPIWALSTWALSTWAILCCLFHQKSKLPKKQKHSCPSPQLQILGTI